MRGPPRPRALRARSMRCWQTRATRSRRASHACSAAHTRTPTRRRGMLRPAARSERLRLRGQRSGGRAHAPGFFGRRGLRVSTRAAAIFWPWMRENFSLPLRFARLVLCVCASVGVGAGACRACSHAQRASMRAMVCVARGGSVERRMLWLWRIPHERRCQAPRVHACLCACIPSPISPRPAVRDRLP